MELDATGDEGVDHLDDRRRLVVDRRQVHPVLVLARLLQGDVIALVVGQDVLELAFVTGIHSGRVRAMLDERGNPVEEASPSVPVQVLGLGDEPLPGVANIGTRPTVTGDTRYLLEVHLFDFAGDMAALLEATALAELVDRYDRIVDRLCDAPGREAIRDAAAVPG